MKKLVSILTIVLVFTFSSSLAEAHPGRTDSSGGHNCSAKSKAKGLCTGYHYHHSGSTTTKKPTSKPAKQVAKPVLKTVDVYIDNNRKNYNPKAYVKNGTTLVPMRAIFEDLGATVHYDSSKKLITAYKGSKKISLGVGNKNGYVTTGGIGSTISLSAPAETYNSSTMVPLRFIGEALDASVKWDSSSSKVLITTK